MNAGDAIPIFPAMPERPWVFDGTVTRIVDSDTIRVELDVGFNLAIAATLRLWGINAPELRGISRPAGEAARAFTAAWCEAAAVDAANVRPIRVLSLALDAFGRVLAIVYNRATGECLNAALLASGHAVPDVRAPIP